MENKKTSVFSNALIWFGAGVSIAEIITGTFFAPLGFVRGTAAILLGHLIGCVLLFFAGYIGGIAKKSAMETTKYSFGSWGSKFFALLNVLQLVGWTGIMIYDGALAVNEIFSFGKWIWAIVIGALIILWIVIGITNLGKINVVTMSLLFILTLVLCKIIFFGEKIADSAIEEAMSFGAAVELAVAMPLSWLPLISDYTKEAEKPFRATLASSLIYGIVSCWMYIIGMGATIFTGESDIAQIAVKSGLGIAGLIIIVLSTVTTTFLDAFSAGISAKTVFEKLDGKWTAVVVALLGTAGAILFNMDNITDFLYYIGSVFAPMIAILIADFFVVKKDSSEKKVDIAKIIIWILGFALYRLLMTVDFILGCTILDMAVTFALTALWGLITRRKKQELQ
ncbi:MAG: putative hydroxymethylpyrimidine transporter CytX [Treponema sp.]|uniref:putative hydroxymethylpyrimidine transporter CytX n=1 Tax=Treponema sp. TaxID=166 RepID=UPI0025DF3921|nr:putative hydroxymethylpyrimidine transporter CytX [Treponema sp.]MBQ8678651.1 putative hydroxymethylpyrimidine transporter CytX [Treponema sp.]